MKRKAVFSLTLLVLSLLPLSASQQEPPKAGDRKIVHLLNRIGFGHRPGDVELVQRIGIEKYLAQQLHPEDIDDSAMEPRIAEFDSLKMTTSEILRMFPQAGDLARQLGMRDPANGAGDPQDQAQVRRRLQEYMRENGLRPPNALLQDLQAQKLIRAVYSERQLQEVMVDFWFNHFNVFWGKGADRWLTTDYEMNAIRPHALGKFEDLLMATAKSPAMLFYLDNHLSASPDSRNPALARLDRRRLNPTNPMNPQAQERLDQARNRRFDINENYARELMELHTLGVDGGYTQKDVQEVARAFTGWTIDQPRQSGTFTFREWMHDKAEKTVLGQRLTDGDIRDGEQVIGILASHPSTARFIATKLVRRFVSDEPPQSLVETVSAVYLDTRGDIRAMLQAIFTSEEFYAPEAYRAKTKSPFELTASALRALAANTFGGPRLTQAIARMGQPLYQYQPPTGFPDRASQWITSGTLVERINFGVALANDRLPGANVGLQRFAPDSLDPGDILDRAIDVLLAGEISNETRAIMIRELETSNEPPLTKAFALVLGSPEFQKR